MKTVSIAALLVAGLVVGGPTGGDMDRSPAVVGDEVPELALEPVTATPAANQEAGTIVEIASQNDSFDTLVKAVKAAGLAETLQGEGPFTVFAPTDEAFSQLPEGTLEELLANPEQLRRVLTYHVVSGRVTAEQVQGMSSAQTVLGQELGISVESGSVRVGDATVVQADVMASNGVIHVIDSVLIPSDGGY